MNKKKLYNLLFPFFIVGFILFIYYCLVVNIFYLNPTFMFNPVSRRIVSIVFLVIFHILLALIVYSYLVSMFKNPGEPPKFWGFYYDSPDEKRKRYCIICNNFKPERCHHCSSCGRCVLVMDHHCPWLNNCVGFKNRKVFILLLIYTLILDIIGVLFVIYPIVLFIIELTKGNTVHLVHLIFAVVGLGLGIVLFFVMIMFLRYHFDLINRNVTTIEHLDEKRGNISNFSYDMGHDFNWKFVLGANKICWPCPYDTGMGAPVGDGVVINKHEYGSSRKVSMKEIDQGYLDDDVFEDDNNKQDWGKEATDPLN